jgi:hypothetical protein
MRGFCGDFRSDARLSEGRLPDFKLCQRYVICGRRKYTHSATIVAHKIRGVLRMAWQQSSLRRDVGDEGGGSANGVFMRAGKNAEDRDAFHWKVVLRFRKRRRDWISIGKSLQGTSSEGPKFSELIVIFLSTAWARNSNKPGYSLVATR